MDFAVIGPATAASWRLKLGGSLFVFLWRSLDRELGKWKNGSMKITLDLPEALLKNVKLRAIREGLKVNDVVADLLRKGLSFAPDSGPHIQLPVTTVDKKTGLPLILCKQASASQEELTPRAHGRHTARPRIDWHHAVSR